MPQLHRTLISLKTDKLIRRYDVISNECAKIWITNEKSSVVIIAEDYYGVAIAEIASALKMQPRVDYVLLNAWQDITQSAMDLCKENNITIVNYIEFRRMLHQIHDNKS